MGNDAPLACLSEFQPLLYDYFKQLFAQVRYLDNLIKIYKKKYMYTHLIYVCTHLTSISQL